TVLDEDDWGRHVSLLGRIVRIEEDVGLRDIDRLAIRYTGNPFRMRNRRRFTAWMQVDGWHGWDGSHPWPVGPSRLSQVRGTERVERPIETRSLLCHTCCRPRGSCPARPNDSETGMPRWRRGRTSLWKRSKTRAFARRRRSS